MAVDSVALGGALRLRPSPVSVAPEGSLSLAGSSGVVETAVATVPASSAPSGTPPALELEEAVSLMVGG